MSRLKTPVICIVIGEGGPEVRWNGEDRVAVLQHAYYSVIGRRKRIRGKAMSTHPRQQQHCDSQVRIYPGSEWWMTCGAVGRHIAIIIKWPRD